MQGFVKQKKKKKKKKKKKTFKAKISTQITSMHAPMNDVPTTLHRLWDTL